jgi:hypothetical protein
MQAREHGLTHQLPQGHETPGNNSHFVGGSAFNVLSRRMPLLLRCAFLAHMAQEFTYMVLPLNDVDAQVT